MYKKVNIMVNYYYKWYLLSMLKVPFWKSSRKEFKEYSKHCKKWMLDDKVVLESLEGLKLESRFIGWSLSGD